MEQIQQLPTINVPSEPEATEPMAAPVSLAPPEEIEQGTGPINLSNPEQVATVPPSASLTQKKVDQIMYGLDGVLKKDQRTLWDSVSKGDEFSIRTEAASILDQDLQKKREELQVNYLKNKKGPLSLDELQTVTGASNALYPTTDPADVVEKAYAQKHIGTLDTAKGVMQKAYQEIPELADKLKDKASTYTTKIMFARNLRDDLDNEIGQQSLVGWGADQLKSFFQVYPELKMRGQVPEVGKISGGLLLGDNIKAQADFILGLPMDQYKKRLVEVANNIKKDNPSLAREFVNYVVGTSTSDRQISNSFTLLSPGDIKAAGSLGLAMLRKGTVYNRAANAMKDSIKATEQLDKGLSNAAVAAEGAGDNAGAAAVRTTDHFMQGLDGSVNPVKDIKESLTSNFVLDGDKFAQREAGNLSREGFTRLKDSFVKTGNSLYEAIKKAAKPNRTPVPLTSEQAIREYQEAQKFAMPEFGNTHLDISKPFHDPVTNTNWVDHMFGNVDGKLFSDPDTAKNYARDRGYPNAIVVNRTGDVEIQGKTYAGGARDLQRMEQIPRSIQGSSEAIKKLQTQLKDKTLSKEAKQELRDQVKWFKDQIKLRKDELKQIQGRVTEIPPRIEQNGNGYAIVIRRPYRETEDITRGWLIKDKAAKSVASQTGFDSWRNAAFGWLRGANDTLSYNETLQRLKVAYARNVLEEWAKEETKKISDIAAGLLRRDPVTGAKIPWWLSKPRAFLGKFTGGNKQMFEEFNRTLDHARTMPDPITGEPGYFFKNAGELDDHYQTFWKRLPTPAEYEAYFAHVKLTEGDRVFREIFEFRNRARIGTEQHQIFFKNEKGERTGSGFFDAIRQNYFPGGKDDQILIMGTRKGEERLGRVSGGDFSSKDIQRWKDEVKQGRAKVFRIYDPDSHPLSSFSDVAGNERVRYILTHDSETKPLEFNHVNRRGGGHFEYDYDHYVKQARVIPQMGKDTETDKRRLLKMIYTGDTTVSAVDNRIMGRDMAKKLDQVRLLIKGNKWAEAEAYTRQNLGIEWDEVKGWFEPKRGPEGKIIPPMLNLEEPFHVVPKNRKIIDIDKKAMETRHGDRFINGTMSGSDAQQFQVSYSMQRDATGLKAIENIGSQYNPVYKWVPAKMVDPIPTMNRALNRAINSVFMDDYKIHAVEHWLQEAIPHMKADPDEILSAPFWHFNTADEAVFKNNPEAKATIRNLLLNKQKIEQFIGMPSKFDTFVHGATQHLVDAFYTKFGPEDQRDIFGKAVTIVPTYLLSKVKDPIQFMRSVTFNAKLGFFNPVQFIVQAQTHANIVALMPRHGTVGTWGGLLHQYARINKNPEIMNHLDDLYTKMNMFGSKAKPGEFKEANELMKKYGFEHVGGEHSYRDDALQYKFFKNDWGNFIDAGQFFFREGEKSPRLAAWYAAVREFRHKNPTGPISKMDGDKILARADILTNNMTRASASNLHTGVFSMSTQFLSYQFRQAELFWGKRLGETLAERNAARARLALFYGGLYGIPSSVGVAGMPFTDMIKQYAIDNGYVVGENYLSSLAVEGVPFILTAMATGGGDMQKGEHLNFGGRFGQQGLTQINEAMKSDTSMWKVVGGASGGVFMNTWTSLTPFWRAARSLVSADEPDNQFKLTATDMLQPFFGEISTYNGIKRQIIAMNTGRWINRNEQYIEDVTGLQALMRNLSGLSPSGQETTYTQANIAKEEAKLYKDAKKEITKYYQRGVIARSQGDINLSDQMMRNVRAIMIQSGINNTQMNEILAQASKNYEKLIDSSNWSFGTDAVPADKAETRLDRLRRQQIIQDKKAQ